MSKSLKKIVILGGGPAGLTAGWKLSELGYKVEVVEKETRLGGLSSTYRTNGFVFDLGGHRFISRDQQVLQDIKDLMGSDLKTRPRKSVIRLRGKYYHYPLEPLDLLFKMNPVTSIRCFTDFLITSLRSRVKTASDISLKDWVTKRFGKSLYNIYFGPYSEKLWGTDPHKISADWASQRISLLNLWEVITHLFRKSAQKPATYATKYLYPEKGIGQVSERMGDIIQDNGGLIHMGIKASRFITGNGRLVKLVGTGESGEREFEGDYFLSTIPLPDVIQSFEPGAAEPALNASKSLTFRSIRFLNLMIDRPRITVNNWIYIPEDRYTFFRIQEPRNWSETTVPEGKTSLILEIACDFGDRLWEMDEKELFLACLQDLNDLGFDLRETEVEGFFSTYAQHAYPKYLLGYKQRLHESLEELRRCSNLLSFGRQGLFRYNNMDHSVKMGMIAADLISGKTPSDNLDEIAAGQEYFESDEALKDLQ